MCVMTIQTLFYEFVVICECQCILANLAINGSNLKQRVGLNLALTRRGS
jgi:hypothetical protein